MEEGCGGSIHDSHPEKGRLSWTFRLLSLPWQTEGRDLSCGLGPSVEGAEEANCVGFVASLK